MALPKIFDYDAASDETIVTEGVEGFEPQWIGLDIINRVMHIVVNEGTISVSGDSIDVVTRGGQQLTMEGQDVVDFYTANKAVFDAYILAAMNKWALEKNKDGSVVY